MRSIVRAVPTLVTCVALAPAALAAQWQGATGPRSAALGAPAGGDVERYLRALVTAGIIRDVPWHVRPFTARDVELLLARAGDAKHPWASSLRTPRAALGTAALATANSGFPRGDTDGPLWQGRGFNGAIGLAATARIGPFTATLAPIAFAAQNLDFPIFRPLGDGTFRNFPYPDFIDLPSRFGDGAYMRAAGGESAVQFETSVFLAGVGTRAEAWGPNDRYPAVLGVHAGGFPHLFVGTPARGLRIPALGRVTARYVLGPLSQSRWSPVTGPDTFGLAGPGTRRLAVGLAASWMPAIVPGLEFGATRFYHSPWRGPGQRWDAWSKPIEGLLKSGFGDRGEVPSDPTGDLANQLASLTARWVLPRTGAELSFEYMREDNSYDLRDLAQEPEQNSAISANVRYATHRDPARLGILTLEYFDGDVRAVAQQRPQGLLYVHLPLAQGHTLDGQLMAQPIGAGLISGQRATWERFTPDGRLEVTLERTQPRPRRTQDGQGLYVRTLSRLPLYGDWIIEGRVATSRRRGPNWVTYEAGIAYAGLWMNFTPRWNLRAGASWSLF